MAKNTTTKNGTKTITATTIAAGTGPFTAAEVAALKAMDAKAVKVPAAALQTILARKGAKPARSKAALAPSAQLVALARVQAAAKPAASMEQLKASAAASKYAHKPGQPVTAEAASAVPTPKARGSKAAGRAVVAAYVAQHAGVAVNPAAVVGNSFVAPVTGMNHPVPVVDRAPVAVAAAKPAAAPKAPAAPCTKCGRVNSHGADCRTAEACAARAAAAKPAAPMGRALAPAAPAAKGKTVKRKA